MAENEYRIVSKNYVYKYLYSYFISCIFIRVFFFIQAHLKAKM